MKTIVLKSDRKNQTIRNQSLELHVTCKAPIKRGREMSEIQAMRAARVTCAFEVWAAIISYLLFFFINLFIDHLIFSILH